MITAVDIAAQAKAWSRKIPATEKGYFIDRARRPRDVDGRAHHNTEGLLRDALRIAELYPWPASEALRGRAESRIKQMQGGDERLNACMGLELITQMLEEPDALLG
jgi:hypothetical protein